MKTCMFCLARIAADAAACPACGEKLPGPPFVKLHRARDVASARLPAPLARFYQTHEGVGIEDEPRSPQPVRLCKLSEVQPVDAAALGLEDAGGWASFAGLIIGAGDYGDSIVFVLRAPVAGAGAVMAYGPDVAGPGGAGPEARHGSVVLARTFDEWLDRLRLDGWEEFGLTPGSIVRLPPERQRQLRAHFAALNPLGRW